jgi:phospholipase D-like protein/putative oligomerization/nucleic acid binding protein
VIIAADYPFLNILWSMIIFFVWVAWIWMMVLILGDLFRRRDSSGWAKAAWVVFLLVLPFLGVLVYLVVNHEGMAERSAEAAQSQQRQFDEYVRSVSGGSVTGEIGKAKQLLDDGAITPEEFASIKARALAAS